MGENHRSAQPPESSPASETPQRPRLEDVARRAGVSTATVSRCLNTPDRVVERTRKKVLEAVNALGYAPNFSARALAARRTHTIGAIIPTMENAIFARALQAFQEELVRHGYTLLVASSSYRADLEADQIRNLSMRGADALLLIGDARAEAVYAELERRGLPFLIAWVHDTRMARPSVGFDNRAAMRALADKVLDYGHRRIAAISAPRAGNDRASQRVEGIRDALQARGAAADKLRVVETPYSVANGAAAFAHLIAETPRPTAILCGNDVLAVGAVRQAKSAGLNVPEDVSVTGFDDIEIAEIVEPALTTVHVPHRLMGIEAARRLVAMLEGDTSVAQLCLETHLCLRQTLAPSPG